MQLSLMLYLKLLQKIWPLLGLIMPAPAAATAAALVYSRVSSDCSCHSNTPPVSVSNCAEFTCVSARTQPARKHCQR